MKKEREQKEHCRHDELIRANVMIKVAENMENGEKREMSCL